MSDIKASASQKPKINRVEVYWHTVTYKTVVIYVLLIVAVKLELLTPNQPDTLQAAEVIQSMAAEAERRQRAKHSTPCRGGIPACECASVRRIVLANVKDRRATRSRSGPRRRAC